MNVATSPIKNDLEPLTSDSSENRAHKLGKYELRSVIGRGNMGTVYRAYDPFGDRDVAIKVCSVSHVNSETEHRMFRRLFFNEAHTAGALSHPNILAVYDLSLIHI